MKLDGVEVGNTYQETIARSPAIYSVSYASRQSELLDSPSRLLSSGQQLEYDPLSMLALQCLALKNVPKPRTQNKIPNIEVITQNMRYPRESRVNRCRCSIVCCGATRFLLFLVHPTKHMQTRAKMARPTNTNASVETTNNPILKIRTTLAFNTKL
jgi:hypothetical protein